MDRPNGGLKWTGRYEEDWITFDQAETNLSNIFEEIGKVYIPALLANLKAINQKEKTWTAHSLMELHGIKKFSISRQNACNG